MREILVAIVLFTLLAGAALVVQAMSWSAFAWAGGALVLLGLVFSIPTAIRYHQLLYRALKSRNVLDPRWIWNPTGQHRHLLPEERSRVMPWFYAGAAGWVVTMLGCVLVGIATVLAWRG